MINLRKMAIDEINEKPFLINQIYDLYQDVQNSFFEYEYNGEVRWLYSIGEHCTILAINGEYIDYASFMLDEDYNLTYMEYDNFDVYRHIDGSFVVSTEGSNVAEALSMLKRGEVEPHELDGVIMHHQINKNTGEEMVVAYLSAYRESKAIFPFNFRVPFFITFFKGGRKTKYLLYETNPDYYSYDIITIKEFGLMEFLKNGSYKLQREEDIKRYFKVKHENKVGNCVLLLPFSRPYKLEEMDEMIKQKGFTRNVNKNTIDYHNGSFPETEEFKELANSIREYDENIDRVAKKKLD